MGAVPFLRRCFGAAPTAASLAQEAVERKGTVSGLAPSPALGTGGFKNLERTHDPIQDYCGRIVVLNFRTTWCIAWHEEMPVLVAVQEAYGPRGVPAIGVSTDDPGRRDLVRRFARRLGPNFPVWVGGTVEGMLRFGLGEALPATANVGRDGSVVMRILGPVERVDLESHLEWFLGERLEPGPEPLVDNFATTPHDHAEEQEAGGGGTAGSARRAGRASPRACFAPGRSCSLASS